LKVLHDWDRNTRSGSYTLWRGINLILYGITKKFPFLNRIKYVRKKNDEIEGEMLRYMETLIKLNRIAGITPIFGIRDEVREKYGERIDELGELYRVDIRRHIHIGEDPDPDRKRVWEPPLEDQDIINARMDSWHFDSHFVKGQRVELVPGELPIWHIDRPNWLPDYIDFIFEELFA